MNPAELSEIKEVVKAGVKEQLKCCIFNEGERSILFDVIGIGKKIKGWIAVGIAASIATPALLVVGYIVCTKMGWM